MAVAARAYTAANRKLSRRKDAVRRVRVRRPKLRAPRFIKPALIVLLLAGVFGYVNTYAKLTATAADRNRLTVQVKREKIRHERLKLRYIIDSSPRSVTAAAERNGMVYATDYDYLRRPQTVASARHDH